MSSHAELGVPADEVDAAVDLLVETFRAGGKVLLFGNGGSAADAQHVAAELVGRFRLDRAALPAIALTTDTSTLTAIANDFGFEHVFARQVEALGAPGDVAFGITTSGASANVLAALDAARRLGLRTICLTGTGADLAGRADVVLAAAGNETAGVQERHLAIEHAVCERVEQALFGPGAPPRARSPQRAGRVVVRQELLDLRVSWRDTGRTVVFTNGCFDLLHVGHVRGLEAASLLGDVLVVAVNDDDSVRALKGEGRPLIPAAERAELVAALASVDYVVVFAEADPSTLLRELQPEVHCKGADYAPPSGKPLPEREAVEAYGGRIEFLPLVEGRSTTALLERARGG